MKLNCLDVITDTDERLIAINKIKSINDEILKLEKLIERKEEDGIYDSDLYDKLESLESTRSELQATI